MVRLGGYLTQTVMDGLTEWIPEEGTPQGPYEASCEIGKAESDAGGVRTISAGRMLALTGSGCTLLPQPTPKNVSPCEGKTTDRRAVCGRSARTVRREGGPTQVGPSYPYPGFRGRHHAESHKAEQSVSA